MDDQGFARHIRACNNARLPGSRLPLRLQGGRLQGARPQGVVLGWIDPRLGPALAVRDLTPAADGGFDLPDASILEELGRTLAEAGHFRFRGEPFDIIASPEGPSLGRIDRGALPAFGLLAAGVHVNGLVERPDGTHLWVGRRAADKLLDPGKLDHLVAGGVAAGYSPEQTLLKEGREECNLPPPWAARAVKRTRIAYSMERPEGLRRDLLHCYDLSLPPDWVPVPNDGEVEEFMLLPLGQVFETVRDTDDFKFNVNLVLIDLFLRRGLIDETSPQGQGLRAKLSNPAALDPGGS